MSNPFLQLQTNDNFIVNRDHKNYRVNPLGIYEFVHEPLPVSSPTTNRWLHVKHVRGGKLRIRNQERQWTAVVCLGVGRSINWAVDWSDNADGLKRYGHGLMVYGQLNKGYDSYHVYGDAGIVEAWDQDNTAGGGIIDAHGWNTDNYFGTRPVNPNSPDGQEAIYILPESEVNGHTVPNDYSYLVYLSDERDSSYENLFAGTDDTCTWELGELTNTKEVTNWRGFFKDSHFVPSLRHLDTSGGTDFTEMFDGAWFSDPGTAKFLKTGNGTSFERMFNGSKNFDADVSDWDMSNATNCHQMFDRCEDFSCNGRRRKGTGIDKWRPEKLDTDGMRNMFEGCHSLEYDASSWRLPLVEKITDSMSWNTHTGLRLPASQDYATIQPMAYENMNEPWLRAASGVGRGQHKYLYHSIYRFLHNPQTGATGELDAQRRILWQAYVDDVDAQIASGAYQSIDNQYPPGGNANDSGAQAKVDQVSADDDALVAAHEP